MEFYYLLLYFFVYGFLGWCTEVGYAALKTHRFVNRGFLNGPICPIYGVGVSIVLAFLTPYKSNVLLLYITSIALVTLLEGLTGWAMDKIFHNKWWDYSNMPFNIGGYVCLLFSLLWGIACVLIMDFIHPVIHNLLVLIPVPLGIGAIVILGGIMSADLYVTASSIFRFNKRLESMEKIAAELRELSDQLGEDIYEKTVLAMEKQEEAKRALENTKQKLDDTAEELREKTQDVISGLQEKQQDVISGLHEKQQEAISGLHEKQRDVILELHEKQQEAAAELRQRMLELKARYAELDHKNDPVALRLLRAFPGMESRMHKDQFHAWKGRIGSRRQK